MRFIATNLVKKSEKRQSSIIQKALLEQGCMFKGSFAVFFLNFIFSRVKTFVISLYHCASMTLNKKKSGNWELPDKLNEI